MEKEIELSGRDIFYFILIAIFGIIFLLFAFGGWYTITAGERGVLLTWGKPDMIPYSEGLHFKWPIAQGRTRIL